MDFKQFEAYWLVNKKNKIIVVDGCIDGEYAIDEYSEYYADYRAFGEDCINEFGGMIFEKVFTEMGIYKVKMHQKIERTPDDTYYNIYIDGIEKVSDISY